MNTSRAAALLVVCAAALAAAGPGAAASQTRIAVMPAQYFAADAQSAASLTAGLAAQFGRQGYRIADEREARDAFRRMGLKPDRHYADSVALKFGRRMGADLVAYPRLLALGRPAANAGGRASLDPAAVVLLRVLNVRTGGVLYARQIAHEFGGTQAASGRFHLPQPVADATAAEVTQGYFERVAGSRQELR